MSLTPSFPANMGLSNEWAASWTMTSPFSSYALGGTTAGSMTSSFAEVMAQAQSGEGATSTTTASDRTGAAQLQQDNPEYSFTDSWKNADAADSAVDPAVDPADGPQVAPSTTFASDEALRLSQREDAGVATASHPSGRFDEAQSATNGRQRDASSPVGECGRSRADSLHDKSNGEQQSNLRRRLTPGVHTESKVLTEDTESNMGQKFSVPEEQSSENAAIVKGGAVESVTTIQQPVDRLPLAVGGSPLTLSLPGSENKFNQSQRKLSDAIPSSSTQLFTDTSLTQKKPTTGPVLSAKWNQNYTERDISTTGSDALAIGQVASAGRSGVAKESERAVLVAGMHLLSNQDSDQSRNAPSLAATSNAEIATDVASSVASLNRVQDAAQPVENPAGNPVENMAALGFVDPLSLHRVVQISGKSEAKGLQGAPSMDSRSQSMVTGVAASELVKAGAGLASIEGQMGNADAKGQAGLPVTTDAESLFHALEGGVESGAGSSALHGFRMSSNEFGVGFVDPQHGWVEVHAATSGGALHASVIAETAMAGQHLGHNLDAAMRAMEAGGQSIASLTVAVNSGGSSDAAGQQSYSDASSAQQPKAANRNCSGVLTTGPAFSTGGDASHSLLLPIAAVGWGGHVSVMA